MGLFDEVQKESVVSRRRNKMDEIKSVLSKKDCEEFVKALLDTRITHAALIRVLQRRGLHIASGTMSTMRREFQRQHEGKNHDIS